MKKYNSYKNSGIEWIGYIPKHWNVIKLKYLARICNGQDQKDVFDQNGEYPIYGSGGIFGMAKKFLYDKPSVLLGRKGTIDKPQFVETPFWSVDTAYFTKIFDNVFPRLFYYLCTTINFDLYKYGSAIPSMTQGTLNEIKFPCPDFSEQMQIANYLDHKTAQIDALISKKEKLIELLNEERTALINQAVTKGLNPDAPMKDSGIEWIGEVPEHWTVNKFGRIAFFQEGPGLRNWQFTEKGIKVICVTNIVPPKIDFSVMTKFISNEEYETTYKHFTVNYGDVLLASSGASWGKVAEYTDTEKVILNTSTIRINEHSSHIVTKAFIKLIIQSPYISENLNQLLTGSCQPNFGPTHLNKLVCVYPQSHDEQLSISNYVITEMNRFEKMVSQISKEIDLLREYRTALISEVVTGKVDVRDEKVF